MARYQVTRRRWGVLISTATLAVAGTGVAVVGSGSSSPDSSAPSVFMTAPAPAASVSGASVTVSATCGDNVACAGVQFKLDGGNLGAEDTSAPFTITWDSTTSTDGAHTLSAIARDAAGNTKTATARTVTVTGVGAGGSLGNLWVDSSGGTCTRAVTPGAYLNNGSECSSFSAAYAAAFPGDTVGFTGTLSTQQTVAVSTSNGKPGSSNVTFAFAAGAKISMAVCGCLNLDGNSHITIDGGTDGIIEGTANGTSLANHQSATAISADPCTNCEIENLTVRNIYVIVAGDTFICASGCTVDNAGARCVRFSGANWLIHNNVFHDASWCLYEVATGSDGNERIYNNEIYNVDHGWTITGGGPFGHLYFYGNHVHDMGLWDACAAGGNNCHHDGIHCFFGPGTGQTFADSYIYNNRFDGTLGSSATAWIYLESNASSPCANAASHWYIFNNAFSSSDQVSTNAYATMAVGTVPNTAYEYNNTFSGPGTGHFGANNAACADTSVDFENNAVGGCNRFNGAGSGTTDHNAYANGVSTSSGDNCWPTGGCAFATWQGTGHDTHGVYNQAGAVGSNVAGVGANLTSLCVGDLLPLCKTIDGVARPGVGAWDAGAS